MTTEKHASAVNAAASDDFQCEYEYQAGTSNFVRVTVTLPRAGTIRVTLRQSNAQLMFSSASGTAPVSQGISQLNVQAGNSLQFYDDTTESHQLFSGSFSLKYL